ncbi:hypothetical protein [Lonsdalea britannica]|uniref:hypothetical protein n=1 Tax=Lonsdalea britannica TaxID=1082704 RepID=UPI001FC9C85D|nr:hypothetical protein [Lonsdalea britannica]
MNNLDHAVLSRMIGEKAAVHGLLNCLIKEFAIPEGHARYAWPDDMSGIPPGAYFDGADWRGIPMTIRLPGNENCSSWSTVGTALAVSVISRMFT